MELSVCKIKIFLIFPEIELSSHIFLLYFNKKIFKLIKKKKKNTLRKSFKNSYISDGKFKFPTFKKALTF